MLEKALGCEPDVLVPDMEDSVPDGEKPSARALIREWLPRFRGHRAAVMPRVNGLETGLTEADLAAVVGPDVWGISIGKITSAADISTISNMIGRLEAIAGLDFGTVRMIPWIETTRAIVHCFEICRASARIAGVAFGGEDYTNDLGVERLDDPLQLLFARSTLITAAHAAGVPALDTPYFRFRDEDGHDADSTASRNLGFKGRFAIHPNQIATINRCYAPTAAEIAHARRIVAAFEEAEARGRGSTSLDGSVIDVPVVKRARALLALAERPDPS
jgi:citrate lyase subunit beta/citryl-CoA lyase